MKRLYKEQSEIQRLQNILNSIPWHELDYRLSKPIDNYIFRIGSEAEIENMRKNNVWSGAFWDTDPASHGRLGMNVKDIMMVSTTSRSYIGHAVIIDRRGIEDIVAVFKWKGQPLYGEWEIFNEENV